jgi:putative ABC transport system permease protein
MGKRNAPRLTVPVVAVDGSSGEGVGSYWAHESVISPETAEDLGIVPGRVNMLATAGTPFTGEQLDRLHVHGIWGWSNDPQRVPIDRMQFAGLGVAGLLSVLVVGVAVALAAAESRGDVATLAAVGAGPWRRRSMGAMHGLFLGLVGSLTGLAVGVPAGVALTQVDGLPGIDVPWLATAGTVAVVLLAAPLAGWLVSPSRLRLTRRTA